MADKYCSACANKLMQTMRVCPHCGNRNFSATPPPQPAPQHRHPNPSPQTPTQSNVRSAAAGVTHSFQPAGLWPRFGAFLIDTLILVTVAAMIRGMGYLIALPQRSDDQPNILTAAFFLASLTVPYVYFTLMHSSAQQATIGKSALGLIIVTVQGERLSKTTAFLRAFLTTLIPMAGGFIFGISWATMATQLGTDIQSSINISFFLGVMAIVVAPYLTLFGTAKRQTLFDLILKTCVVKKTIP